MKRHYPEHISSIISKAIAASGSTDTYRRQQLCYLWGEIVGPTVNRVTVRRWVERDELHVVIASGVIKNELGFMSSRLVEALNRAVGSPVITRLVIH